MNYINFKYDLDNLIYYYESDCKFCFDQILYNFKDNAYFDTSSNQLENSVLI